MARRSATTLGTEVCPGNHLTPRRLHLPHRTPFRVWVCKLCGEVMPTPGIIAGAVWLAIAKWWGE